ncbi:hypothetical protein CLS_14920 [[Clostridium] cf. saccharolyticum K10]|nr:hypothetical protein CLS_14920 [[Clostridium] cf. saccharolyticum K10]
MDVGPDRGGFESRSKGSGNWNVREKFRTEQLKQGPRW